MNLTAGIAMTDQVRTMAADWIASRSVEEIHDFGRWLQAMNFEQAPPRWQDVPVRWRDMIWLFAVIGIVSVTRERMDVEASPGGSQ